MVASKDQLEVARGTKIPPLQVSRVSRTDLALFCGASGDHNPLHVDIDAARDAGFDDVFAHGMLPMAYMGRLLTSCFPQSSIRSFDVRFIASTPVNAALAITACADPATKVGEEMLTTVRVEASLDDGTVIGKGQAVVALL